MLRLNFLTQSSLEIVLICCFQGLKQEPFQAQHYFLRPDSPVNNAIHQKNNQPLLLISLFDSVSTPVSPPILT